MWIPWIIFPLSHKSVDNYIFLCFFIFPGFPLSLNIPRFFLHNSGENELSSWKNSHFSTPNPQIRGTFFSAPARLVRLFHMSTPSTTNTILYIPFLFYPFRDPSPALSSCKAALLFLQSCEKQPVFSLCFIIQGVKYLNLGSGEICRKMQSTSKR